MCSDSMDWELDIIVICHEESLDIYWGMTSRLHDMILRGMGACLLRRRSKMTVKDSKASEVQYEDRGQ